MNRAVVYVPTSLLGGLHATKLCYGSGEILLDDFSIHERVPYDSFNIRRTRVRP
jgi:hypothetical protein